MVVAYADYTITDLNDGQNAIQMVLSNENHTLTADSSGTVISYTGAETTAYVYDGATDVTNEYTISKVDPSGVTSSVSGKTVKVTAITNGIGGSIAITLTRGSTVLTKVFAVSLSKTGSDGTAAKAVNVVSSSQVFKSTTGAAGPFEPTYIYLYPSFQGGISYSKWQYSTDGTTWNNVISGSNSLTIGTYNSVANSLRIERTCDLYTSSITAISFKCVSSDANYYDTETVIKVYDVTDIQVGGRNFILRSDFVGKPNASGTGYSRTFSDGEVTFTNTELDINNTFSLQLSDYAKSNLRGATITVSMEYMVTDTLVYGTTNPWVGFELSIYRNESIGGSSQYINWQGSKSIPTNITNTWVRTSNTRTITDFDFSSINLGVYFRDVTGTIKLRHPKIEIGNVATDWTLAPEDSEPNVIVQLANESYTFPADSNGVPQVATLEVPVYGFKGTTQVATSIGTITGAPAGMTTYISGQSSTSNKFTLSIATTLTSVNRGELTIPITVEDITINKKFTWAKSIAGTDGSPASLVTISPSALFFKSTDGVTYDPNYIYLYPYFTNTTYSKWEYSTNGTTWNTISSGSHGLNIGTYNNVAHALRVTCVSDLYTNSTPQVSFKVTATNGGTSYYDTTSLARLKDGQNGTSAYLHIKYSDDGINFTKNNGDTPGQYIGMLVDNNPTASTTFSDYTWKKFTEDFTATTEGTGYLPLAKSAGQPMLEFYIEGKTYQPIAPTWADPVQPQFVSKDNVLTMVSLNANRLNPRQLALSLVSGSTVYGTGAEATSLENGLRVTSIAAGTGNKTMAGIVVQNPEDLLGKVVRLSTTMHKSASNNPYLRLTWYDTTSGSVSTSTLTYLDATGSKTYTVPSTFASGYNSLVVVMYSAHSGTGTVGDYAEYTNLTLHLESDNVDYEQFQAVQSTIDLGYSELCSLPDGTKNTLTITNNRNIYWCPIGQYKFNGTESWSMITKTNTYVFTNSDVKSSYTNGYSNYSTYASGTTDTEHFNISTSGLNVYFPKNFSYIDGDDVSHNVNSAESFALYLSYLNSVGNPFYIVYKLQAPKSLVLDNCSVLTEYGTGILRPNTYDATNMAVRMSGTYFIQTDVSEVFATNNDLLNYQTVRRALADIQTIEDTISTFAQTYVTTGTLNEAITNSKTTQEKFTSDSVSLLTTYVRDALGSIEDVEKIVNGTNIIDMSTTTDITKSTHGLTISVYPDDVLGYRIKVNGTATANVIFRLYGTGAGAPSVVGPSLKAGDAYSVYGLVPGVSLTVSTWDSSSGSTGAYVELFTRNSSQSSSYFTPTDLTTADYIYLTFESGSTFDEVSFVPRFCSGAALSANMSIIQSYINWSGDALWIGKSTSSVRMKLEYNKLSFLSGQDEVAYISNSTLFITDATVQLVQRLGKPSLGYWESRFNETNRNLNIRWVGPTQA